MTKPTILLVDYDPKTIESTVRPLADAGYEVEVAKDGEAGLEALGRLEPDLVLLEMMLPKKPGLELCREIRRARPRGGPPILILGHSSAEKYRSLAVASGADAYVPRATGPRQLVEICNLHLMGGPIGSGAPLGPPTAPSELFLPQPLPSGTAPDAPGPEEIEASLDALFSPRKGEPARSAPRTPASSTARAISRKPVGARAIPRSVVLREPTRPRRGRKLQAWGIVLTGAAALILGVAFVRGFRGREDPRPTLPKEMDLGAPLEAAIPAERDVPRPSSEAVAEPSAQPATAPASPPEGAPGGIPSARASRVGMERSRPEPPAAPIVKPALPSSTGKPRSETVVRGQPPRNAEAAKPLEARPEESGLPSTAPAEATQDAPAVEPPAPSSLLVQSAPLLGGDGAWPESERSASVGDLVDLKDVDSPPVAVSRPTPTYPEAARRMRRQGTVSLRLLVDETGGVSRVEPAGGAVASEFLPAAERAARKWTYEPARKDGVPVKVWVTVQVVFKP